MSYDSVQLNFKPILHSARANIYYLEKCRVQVDGNRVVYYTDGKDRRLEWNIPIANTTVILLGIGTSITQKAVCMLSKASVMLGFCGNGGTPLYSGTDIEWFSPQSEYRPTEYMQAWMSFWFDENKRIAAAKLSQMMRCNNIINIYSKDKDISAIIDVDFDLNDELNKYKKDIKRAVTVNDLLTSEAKFTKNLYRIISQGTDLKGFKREHEPDHHDIANQFLNHGNYLAYGLAATTLWVLGLSSSFPLIHGKTRRGALVFDIADIIKDAIVIPTAFISAKRGDSNKEFRLELINKFAEHKIMDRLFDAVKEICEQYGEKIK